MLDQSRIDLPLRQARLRDACCIGDARAVERLTSTQACGWRGALLRSLGLGKQHPASLEFVYVTDHGRTALHYIASGIHHRHPHLGELYSSEDVTCASANSSQRAELLSGLIERGHFPMNMDWNMADTGGKTAIYWAALSHSKEVLQVLCSLARTGNCNIDASIPDHSNSTPLDVAVASQQWDMVKLLLQSGGLKDNVRLQNAVDNLAELAPDVVMQPEGSRNSWDGISTLVSTLFGFWNCGKQMQSSYSSNSLDMAKEGANGEEDIDVEDGLAERNDSPSPLVFCSMQEVEAYWHEQALYVSDVCGIDDVSARQLLKENSHDADAAIKGFLANTKMVHRSPPGQALLVSMQKCCVCFTEFSSLSSNVKLPCGHDQACSNCWRQFILAKLEDGHASHLQCMSVGCHMPVPLSEARKVLTDESYEQLQRQVLRCYIDSNPHIKWCPRPDCSFSISLADQICAQSVSTTALNTGAFTVHCACGHAFCWNCLEDAHEPASCEQVRNWKRLINSEHLQQNQESEDWLEFHTQPCPTCTAKVQRTGGCNHMICSVCSQHFCYVCGRDWSLHGPQTGGFYSCTITGGAPPDTSLIKAFTTGVSSAVRNALRNLYRRENYYLRRYFAQSEDTVDLTTVVRHMRHLVSNALVLDSSTSTDRSPSPGLGETRSGSSSPETTASEGCCPHESADINSRAAPGVLSFTEDASTSTFGDLPTQLNSQGSTLNASTSIRNRGPAASAPPRDTQAGQQHACVSLCGNEIERLAEATYVSRPVRAPSARCSTRQETDPYETSRRISKLHPKAHMRRILQEWEQSVTNGRNILRNTYIATYYMERCNERVYLEALQQRLEGELGQLTEMLRQLPHRRAMLEGAHNVDRAPGLRKDSISVFLAMVCNIIRDVSHGLLCTVLRVLNAQSTVLEEVSLRGRQIRDQFYYVVALNQQRSRIVRLLHRVNCTCHAIVRSGRVRK